MLNKILNMLKLDAKIMLRNGFLWVVLGMSLFYVILVRFVIPEELKLTPVEYILDNTTGYQVVEYFSDIDEVEKMEGRFVATREELMEQLEGNGRSLGIVFEDHQVTVIRQGYENNENINLLVASIDEVMKEIGLAERPVYYEYEFLRNRTEIIPLNKYLIPVFLATDVAMLGFFFVAVMMFQEKKEGSIAAYRVSPGGTFTYMLSKILLNTLLSVLFGWILAVFTLGFTFNYLHYTIIIFLVALFISILGLLISLFFKDISEFIYVAMIIFVVLSFPIAAYLYPSLSVPFFRFIPSYPVMFTIREILFTTGKSGILEYSIILLIQITIASILCYKVVDRKLLKNRK
ncbi:ABC transporter permease [Alkaliphilus peptidifermentans]|uniref:ABC-2 type transport system permease protein n=1 Tax=Alkaliphilus peptidifermentans DSM 18978 TaxID=1120976 RepID=A0A1G5KB13_9FIRM|nr:ABC transporter permease [Alkaliphilus peptidifermentans]SCY97248.1 ABC-2 type transport system permease protein [Alkaliphilus peptidifermentans DSM 18978]